MSISFLLQVPFRVFLFGSLYVNFLIFLEKFDSTGASPPLFSWSEFAEVSLKSRPDPS